MNQGEFELSTAAMDQAAQECRLMAQRMRDPRIHTALRYGRIFLH